MCINSACRTHKFYSQKREVGSSVLLSLSPPVFFLSLSQWFSPLLLSSSLLPSLSSLPCPALFLSLVFRFFAFSPTLSFSVNLSFVSFFFLSISFSSPLTHPSTLIFIPLSLTHILSPSPSSCLALTPTTFFPLFVPFPLIHPKEVERKRSHLAPSRHRRSFSDPPPSRRGISLSDPPSLLGNRSRIQTCVELTLPAGA